MNKPTKSLDELLNVVKPGSVWAHTNGLKYVVLHIANVAHRHPRYPVTVVYQNVETGTIWARALAEWERSFTQQVEGIS